jgi:hypothetical protein
LILIKKYHANPPCLIGVERYSVIIGIQKIPEGRVGKIGVERYSVIIGIQKIPEGRVDKISLLFTNIFFKNPPLHELPTFPRF